MQIKTTIFRLRSGLLDFFMGSVLAQLDFFGCKNLAPFAPPIT